MAGKIRIERSTVLFVLFFFITGLFLFSLFQHQVLDHAKYVAAAAAQSTSTIQQPAERGQILARDKDGNTFTLAVSDWTYLLEISPAQVNNKQRLLNLLKNDIPTLDIGAVYSKINNNDIYVPPVMTGLDAATAQTITNKGYAGVYILPTLTRVYPDGANIAPQALGFVGGDGHGKSGVEAYYDDQLQGSTGSVTTELDSLGKLINIVGSSGSKPGKDVVLTIDYNLQYLLQQDINAAVTKYKADSGSAVVMDPNTGAILADVGDPNFDPNHVTSLTESQIGQINDPVITSTYEPGSVVKPLTMAMALESGVVQPTTTHNAGGSVTIDGYTIKNALNKNYGNETMSQVLQNSDNVQMSWISTLLTAEQQRKYLDSLGFGKPTGVDEAGEQTGYLPAIASWNPILRATAAFGQGISTTLLQLAMDYSAIANGGHLVKPHFLYGYATNGTVQPVTQPGLGAQVFSATTASAVKSMLVDVVNLGEGHAAGVTGIQVAGKTGTAQVPSPKGGYDPTQTIGSFIGMFPADNPKFVLAVRINNPKTVNFAESSAAPTFGEIATWMTNYYGLR